MNLDPRNWNMTQASAAGKHVLSFIAGAVAFATAAHFISAEQAGGITQNINDIVDGLTTAAKGAAGLLSILTVIYTSYKAANNSSPESQINNVVKNLSAPQITQIANAVTDPAGRNKLINAVAGMPEVRAIVAPESVINDTASPKVVGTAAEVSALPLGVPR